MADHVSAAREGWFKPEIILAIITDPVKWGIQFSTKAPNSPSSGQLYLFDKLVVKDYKQDGVNWIKKKGSGRVQEVHQIGKVNREAVIVGYHSTSADLKKSFRKRSYRLNSPLATVFLVHYLECEGYTHATNGGTSVGGHQPICHKMTSKLPHSGEDGSLSLLLNFQPTPTCHYDNFMPYIIKRETDTRVTDGVTAQNPHILTNNIARDLKYGFSSDFAKNPLLNDLEVDQKCLFHSEERIDNDFPQLASLWHTQSFRNFSWDVVIEGLN